MGTSVYVVLLMNGCRTLYGYAFTEKRRRLTRRIDTRSLEAAAARVAARTTPSIEEAAQTPEPSSSEVVSATAERVVVEETPVIQKKRKASKKSTPRSAGPVAPITPNGAAAVSSDRAQDIQSSLSAFRDTVIARQASSDSPIPKVVEWVSAHMLGRGKSACTEEEMEIVLESLSERDALMITDDDAHGHRTVWFI